MSITGKHYFDDKNSQNLGKRMMILISKTEEKKISGQSNNHQIKQRLILLITLVTDQDVISFWEEKERQTHLSGEFG